jgi:hypothetical protein
MQSSDPFSTTYAQARTKFRAAADRAQTGMEVYTSALLGPAGSLLATDVAGINLKGAERVLVLQSATHGVEGYCGSACQTMLLNSGISQRLPKNMGLMMIHAINPHGFAYDRRVTEDNVDLNRNFVDFEAPLPRNSDYDQLKAAIAPPDLTPETIKAANDVLREFSHNRGAPMLQAAISRGQYHHADGIYFGGLRPTWSRLTFEGIMGRMPDSAAKIAFIDFHTSLGPEGYGELIIEEAPGTAAYERARAWYGTSVKSTLSGESVSAQLVGTIDASLGWLLRDREVTALALEYGTVPSNEVFAALRADNWLSQHGNPDLPEAEAIKARIRAAFYVETPGWKHAILTRAREVVDQAIAGLGA